jgi:hypothetical protein
MQHMLDIKYVNTTNVFFTMTQALQHTPDVHKCIATSRPYYLTLHFFYALQHCICIKCNQCMKIHIVYFHVYCNTKSVLVHDTLDECLSWLDSGDCKIIHTMYYFMYHNT